MRVQLKRDKKVPLVFDGELIAEVSTKHRRDRWTELRLYRLPMTAGVEYVAEQVGATSVDGELDRCTAFACHNAADVRRVIGTGPLARQLYKEAGFDGVEDLTRKP